MKTFKDLLLNVSDDKSEVEIVYIGLKRAYVAEHFLDNSFFKELKFNNSKVNVSIIGSNEKRTINEIRIKDEKNQILGTIQFAKESVAFLEKEYGFKSNYGYVVIERNTFDLESIHKNKFIDECLCIYDTKLEKEKLKRDYADFMSMVDLEKDYFFLDKKLQDAIYVTKYIWSKFIGTGPSNGIRSYFGVFKTLQLLAQNEALLQCSGTRDVFMKLTNILNLELKFRRVEAYRYYPFIKNIIVNGHSVLEISINDKWVLFDLFVRVFFMVKDTKNLLSAEDIQGLLREKKLDKILVIHIKTSHSKRDDFDARSNPFDPYNYNYFTHFNFLIYKKLKFEKQSILDKMALLASCSLLSLLKKYLYGLSKLRKFNWKCIGRFRFQSHRQDT